MNYWKKLKKNIPKFAAGMVIFMVKGYRLTFSPSVGFLRYLAFYPKPSCIFYPTCSQYSIECFRKYPFSTAVQKTINRIGRCHGGNEPMVDLP